MTHAPPLVVFTDLDGTLLDHASYDWSPARPALRRLSQLGVPVILSSSKTGAEIKRLQQAMDLTACLAIAENGAGLIGAEDQASPDRYADLRDALDHIPQPLRKMFKGFGDMTLDEVMQTTGLTRYDAELAQQRAFSEPGLWLGTPPDQDAFLDLLRRHGVTARMGGRFLTLSFGATKADRLAEVIAHYAPQKTIALGDAPNDIEMLEAADLGIIIANPDHAPLTPLAGEATGRIIRTQLSGPVGWNAAILSYLDQSGLSKGPPPHG